MNEQTNLFDEPTTSLIQQALCMVRKSTKEKNKRVAIPMFGLKGKHTNVKTMDMKTNNAKTYLDFNTCQKKTTMRGV